MILFEHGALSSDILCYSTIFLANILSLAVPEESDALQELTLGSHGGEVAVTGTIGGQRAHDGRSSCWRQGWNGQTCG